MANPDVGLAKGKEEKANFELHGVGVTTKTVKQDSPAALSSSLDR